MHVLRLRAAPRGIGEAAVVSAHAVPHSRTGDPVSSYLAGEEVHAGGLAERQSAAILSLVTRNPCLTSRELAGLAEGIDRHAIARRLPELERAGLVVRAGFRRCRAGGRLSVTWGLPPAQGRLL